MKVLYVSDNRCRGNYGCRATSTALSQLVEEDNQIVGFISGRYTNLEPGALVVNKKWPPKKYLRFAHLKRWGYISKVIYRFNRWRDKKTFFLGKHDFLDYDLDASISYFINCLPANQHLKEYDLRQYDFDAIVVNGEGSFIFSTPVWREGLFLAFLMNWAQRLGKKVFFMNAMLSDDPNSPHDSRAVESIAPVFDRCDVVQVREKYSYNYAKKYFPNIKQLVLKPDALFSWYDLVNDGFEVKDGKYFMPLGKESNSFYKAFNYSGRYILVAGSSSSRMGKNIEQTIEAYALLVSQLKDRFKDHTIYIIETCDGDSFLYKVGEQTNTPVIPVETPIVAAGKILANAEVFVTGRYHPAILASLGGTPCVFMSSNSHKTISLQELLELDKVKEYNCVPSVEEIDEMVKDVEVCIENNCVLRDRLRKRVINLANEARSIKKLIH